MALREACRFYVELVREGADSLIGEIIRLEGDNATIQVCAACASCGL